MENLLNIYFYFFWVVNNETVNIEKCRVCIAVCDVHILRLIR